MNTHFIVNLLMMACSCMLFNNKAIASTDSDQNEPLLKGKVQESAEDASIWQKLNTRLIQGKCQLTPTIPQLLQATITKSLIPASLSVSSGNAASTIPSPTRLMKASAKKNNITAFSAPNREMLRTTGNQTPHNKIEGNPGQGGDLIAAQHCEHFKGLGQLGAVTMTWIGYDVIGGTILSQHDLLMKELRIRYLRVEWQRWIDTLDAFLLDRLIGMSTGGGASCCGFIFTVRSGHISEVTMNPEFMGPGIAANPTCPTTKYFNDCAKQLLNCLDGSALLHFPINSQVQELGVFIDVRKRRF